MTEAARTAIPAHVDAMGDVQGSSVSGALLLHTAQPAVNYSQVENACAKLRA